MKKIFIFLFFCSIAYPQMNFSGGSAKIGAIRNFQEIGSKKYALYPEIGVEGELFTKRLNWNINIGYWDDGIDQPIYEPDRTSLSNSCYVFGFKLDYKLHNLFNEEFYLSLTLGITYNIKERKDIITGDELTSENFFQPNCGLRFNYNLSKNFFLVADIGTNIGTGKENLGRPMFLLGAGYHFNF
jgi:hypothetical protein